MSQVMQENKDFSLVRFFNCHDLSDCTLEITEDPPNSNGAVVAIKESQNAQVKNENNLEGSLVNLIDCKRGVTEEHCAKRQKLEECLSMFDQTKENNPKKTILFIHSLLFCSNSEYFQKILMVSVRPKNIQLFLKPGETEFFIKLVKLFYDPTPITSMTLLECTQILKYANRFQCANVSKKLLDHISHSKIPSTDILNQCVIVFKEISANESKELSEIVVQLKKSCVLFLKETFCPVEKVFGPLLKMFLQLNLDAIIFMLDYLHNGIAVSEETVISLVLFWAKHTKSLKTENRADVAMAILEHCWIEHLNGTSFVMDTLCLSHPFLSKSNKFFEFYMYTLEYLACKDKSSYFPDHPQRLDRKRNFAYDHEVYLFFSPKKSSPSHSAVYKTSNSMILELETLDKNLFFVQGYMVRISAAIFNNNENTRELKLKLKVLNLHRTQHSNLYFSLLYAIASPSVSETFSPWSHCTLKVESTEDHAWALISLIAEHSKISNTGFCLKFYLE